LPPLSIVILALDDEIYAVPLIAVPK